MKLNHSLPIAVVSLVALTSAVTTRNALALPVQFPDNGHSYQVFVANLNWHEARAAAVQMGGYLATITSQAENDFLTSLLVGVLPTTPYAAAWLGGYQPPGSPEPGGNWQWLTGEAFTYQNWNGSEPNNGGLRNEDANQVYGMTFKGAWLGKWNDANAYIPYGTPPAGYVVEYGEFQDLGTSLPQPTPPGVPDGPVPLTVIAGLWLACVLGFQSCRRLAGKAIAR